MRKYEEIKWYEKLLAFFTPNSKISNEVEDSYILYLSHGYKHLKDQMKGSIS
jgi:hypothetical protein